MLKLMDTKFVQNYFADEYDPTIEDPYCKQVVIDDEVALLDILDTAGQEEYSAMREQYMRVCEGMILVYSICSRQSFKEIVDFHQQLLRVKDKDKFPVMIIANKCDLTSEREVSMMEGMQLAKQLQCNFTEVTAKTNQGITLAFCDLVRAIRAYNKETLVALSQVDKPSPRLSKKESLVWSVSIPFLVPLFTSFKLPWNIGPDREVTMQTTLNRMLVQASRSNNKRLVRKLIMKGADPNGQPGVEGSALHAAAAVGHVDIVRLLIKAGAAINAKGPRGITALQSAAIEGQIVVVRLLLDRGALADTPSGHHGTALVAAASRGHLKVVRTLIKSGANVNAQGGPYGNALQAAAIMGNVELTKLLLDEGGEVNDTGANGCTALQAAAFAGKTEVVKLLLHRGADLNLQGRKYGCALIAAHDKSHFEIVKLLLSVGASEEHLIKVSTRSEDASQRPGEPSAAMSDCQTAENGVPPYPEAATIRAGVSIAIDGSSSLLQQHEEEHTPQMRQWIEFQRNNALRQLTSLPVIPVDDSLFWSSDHQTLTPSSDPIDTPPISLLSQSTTQKPLAEAGNSHIGDVKRLSISHQEHQQVVDRLPRQLPRIQIKEPLQPQLLNSARDPMQYVQDLTSQKPAANYDQSSESEWLNAIMSSSLTKEIVMNFRNRASSQVSIPRIKVAILDTGYDKDAIFFNQDRDTRLKGWKDWVDNLPYPQDQDGHGTHVLSLIMKIAPAADIFVSRVSKDEKDLQNASNNIAQVIRFIAFLFQLLDVAQNTYTLPGN